MALINRLGRLFQADMHAVLDRIEEPETLLRQSIREMESAHEEETQRYRLLEHELDMVSRRLIESEHALESVDDELDICFQSNQEALAKRLVRKKLELTQRHTLHKTQQAQLQQSITSLHKRIEENSTSLERMRQKAEILSRKQAPGPQPFEDPLPSIREEDVEVAFLQEQQKRRSA